MARSQWRGKLELLVAFGVTGLVTYAALWGGNAQIELESIEQLTDLGLDEARARKIMEHVEPAAAEFRAAEQEILKTAGTTATPEYLAAVDRLTARLQAALGPEDYDWVIYTTDRDNRVIVREVAQGDTTGLRQGDVIQRYGKQLVFTREDLRRGLGQTSEPQINVQILRDGKREILQVEHAPLATLGVVLEARRERPSDPVPSVAAATQ